MNPLALSAVKGKRMVRGFAGVQQRLEKCWASGGVVGDTQLLAGRLAQVPQVQGKLGHSRCSLYRRGRNPGERKEPLGQLGTETASPLSPGRAPHCAPKLTSLKTVQTLSNLERTQEGLTPGSSTYTLRLPGKHGLGAGPGTRGAGPGAHEAESSYRWC